MKNTVAISVVFLLVFLLILSLTFNGKLHFGYGLGDLIYLYLTGAMSILNFILLMIARSSLHSNKVLAVSILILNISVLLFSIYGFTIGRGSESPWDGRVFF